MKKYLGFVAISAFLFSCADTERDNQFDKHAGNNYVPPPSSSAPPSSSSIVPSSSSIMEYCTAGDNTQTHYCFEGTMKEYGSVTINNKPYKTVVIGSQTWMAENLNSGVSGSWCYGDNSGYDPENKCGTYGRLYNWAMAKTVCPSGWRLPTKEDLELMISIEGKKLKAVSGWTANNGTDDYGFSALPGGSGSSGGNFYGVGNYGYWWSASGYDNDNAYRFYMGYQFDDLRLGYELKSSLFSVRCLR